MYLETSSGWCSYTPDIEPIPSSNLKEIIKIILEQTFVVLNIIEIVCAYKNLVNYNLCFCFISRRLWRRIFQTRVSWFVPFLYLRFINNLNLSLSFIYLLIYIILIMAVPGKEASWLSTPITIWPLSFPSWLVPNWVPKWLYFKYDSESVLHFDVALLYDF